MRVLVLCVVLAVSASASVPVRDGCSADASILASVEENDAIQVRHAVFGEATACYAVSVTQGGAEVRGFILGSTLPAIQEFEKRRALESRVPVAAPPATEEPKALPPLKPIGPPFEAWSGVTTEGRRMHIDPAGAKVTLVTFWSASSGAARRYMERLDKSQPEFRKDGLKSFGFVEGADRGRANYWMDDMGLDSPQALDVQKLGAKYGVDASKGATLVIDASNNVVAISSNPAEVRAIATRLLSSK